MMFGKKNSLMKRLGMYEALRDANISNLIPEIEDSIEPFMVDKQSELELAEKFVKKPVKL